MLYVRVYLQCITANPVTSANVCVCGCMWCHLFQSRFSELPLKQNPMSHSLSSCCSPSPALDFSLLLKSSLDRTTWIGFLLQRKQSLFFPNSKCILPTEKSITINQISWRKKIKQKPGTCWDGSSRGCHSLVLVKNSESTLAYDMRHRLLLKRFNGSQFNLNWKNPPNDFL